MYVYTYYLNRNAYNMIKISMRDDILEMSDDIVVDMKV